MHLKQPGYIYCACGPFTKHHERIKKFRETGHLKHLYTHQLAKACFAHNAAYSDSKDLAKRIISGKILEDKAYEIARNCKYDGYQRALTCMVYNFFDKETGSGVSVNKKLAEEFHNSTGGSSRSFYHTFNKRSDLLETLLKICRPNKVLPAGSLCRPSLPSPQSKCPKRTFILPQKYDVSVSNMLL